LDAGAGCETSERIILLFIVIVVGSHAIAIDATDVFTDNWRQAKTWMMPLAGAVEVIALAQDALRRFTQ